MQEATPPAGAAAVATGAVRGAAVAMGAAKGARAGSDAPEGPGAGACRLAAETRRPSSRAEYARAARGAILLGVRPQAGKAEDSLLCLLGRLRALCIAFVCMCACTACICRHSLPCPALPATVTTLHLEHSCCSAACDMSHPAFLLPAPLGTRLCHCTAAGSGGLFFR